MVAACGSSNWTTRRGRCGRRGKRGKRGKRCAALPGRPHSGRMGNPRGNCRISTHDVAVAQILLERVQDRLPQWAALTDHGIQLARQILDRRAQRKVELWPRHLLTINWADSGPGFDWPVSYNAIYVPGFDRTVVTASGDCADAFGACDVALGYFGPDTSLLEGSGKIIRGDWASQRLDHEQQRWAKVVTPGLVSEAEANAWADEVWLDHEDASE